MKNLKMTTTLSLIAAMIALVTGGCETSNNYSNSSRVIDATSAQATLDQGAKGNKGVMNSPVTTNKGPAVLTDAPLGGGLVDAPLNDGVTGAGATVGMGAGATVGMGAGTVTGTGAGLGSSGSGDIIISENMLPIGSISDTGSSGIMNDGIQASSGSLIGGVPDEPMPGMGMSSTNNVTAPGAGAGGELLANNNQSSGDWLLLDSQEAREDVSNTAAQQRALELKEVNESARTVYQNKLATTAGPDRYAVVKGDTLYSIAFRYGLDYHALANINKIDPPYNLSVGQILVLNMKAQEAPSYIVQKGDTLYSIARKNGQSVSFLAGVNNLEPPYNLSVGQKILLSRDNAMGSAPVSNKDTVVPVAGQQNQGQTQTAGTKPATKPGNNSANQQTAQNNNKVPAQAQTPIVNSKTRNVGGVAWSWPTTGRVIEQFSTAEQGNKGIDIAGKRGQAVLSAADGQVVYSGNALRGFGNLIIINHSNEYLSAYAHNDVLLVKEGQKVKRGQQIARMGNTDTTSPRLHFEIRYRGQSVNPVSYLPK